VTQGGHSLGDGVPMSSQFPDQANGKGSQDCTCLKDCLYSNTRLHRSINDWFVGGAGRALHGIRVTFFHGKRQGGRAIRQQVQP